jgi:hypothetical protein
MHSLSGSYSLAIIALYLKHFTGKLCHHNIRVIVIRHATTTLALPDLRFPEAQQVCGIAVTVSPPERRR